MSFFDSIAMEAPDPILGLTGMFKADQRKHKINLTAGVYKTEDLTTPILSSVKKIEESILDAELSKEYLSIEGDLGYLHKVADLIFSKSFYADRKEHISSFQTLGGTGALRLGAEFIKKELSSSIFVSDPSWPNHKGIFSQCGIQVETYPYYDTTFGEMKFEEMIQSLENAPFKSCILFHASCHNPSGKDPSQEQWKALAAVCKKRSLLPFFDAAYLGFGVDFEEDAWPIRHFAELGMEMMIAVSFSKNFSLYGERIGALYIISESAETTKKITSQVKVLIRRNYSNPQLHGMKIVKGILSDPYLYNLWMEELCQMRSRVYSLKEEFSSILCKKVRTKNYEYLKETKGMFCFCGLDKVLVEKLIKEYAIYLTYDGRINIAGLTKSSMEYVADSIAKVIN